MPPLTDPGPAGPLRGRVLIVAGSDSGGGAGIQADLKTISAFGAYGATAITALTVQDTLGVHAVMPVPAAFVRAQMERVLDDIGADAVKTGMLGSVATIEAVATVIGAHAGMTLVLDPVMIAKGGHALLDPEALDCLIETLLPLTTLVTPNAPEAAALTGLAVDNEAGLFRAAEMLLRRGAKAVLVKGGHLAGDPVVDVLVTGTASQHLVRPRLATRHTHGTGCTLASAVAAGLAQGVDLALAVRHARDYVQAAIEQAPGFGAGHGPLNHNARWHREWNR